MFGRGHRRHWVACSAMLLWLVPELAHASPTPTPTPSPEEKLTAPPLPGGRRSIGMPPPPRVSAASVEQATDRPSDVGLVRQPNGEFLYVDPGRMFTMTVRPDGRVLFADRWRRPSAGNAQHGKVGRRKGGPMLVSLNVFGGAAVTGPLEWIMLATGHDLAAGAKRAALRETRDFRTQLAVGWTRARVRKRLAELPADLLALWSDDGMDSMDRRRILFDRWDECEDRLGVPMDGLPPDAIVEVDMVRRAAADKARREIESFIRRHAAKSGQDPFSDAELARLNRRRVSVAPFDPYRSGRTPRPAAAVTSLPPARSKLPSKLPRPALPPKEDNPRDANAEDQP